MKSDMTEKRILLVDGEELPGLVSMAEYTDEHTTVRVPGRDKDVPVKSGVRVIPEVDAVFKVQRNSQTMKILEDWYKTNGETHDVTIIRTDGGGSEFKRELWPNTELCKFNGPGYDASGPTYAQIMVRFAPEDIIYLSAE